MRDPGARAIEPTARRVRACLRDTVATVSPRSTASRIRTRSGRPTQRVPPETFSARTESTGHVAERELEPDSEPEPALGTAAQADAATPAATIATTTTIRVMSEG